MSEVKVNKISPRTACGTVTLGDSGDTFTVASGATIQNLGTATGFGGTGVVSWDTGSIKTAGFTAVTGTGYFCNTTGGAFTVTLPLSPAAGAVVGVADYAQTFSTDNLTLGRNGSNIGGIGIDATVNTEGVAVTLVYVDATKGWIVTDSGLASDASNASYIAATGGCITTCGNFKMHKFIGPGTFCVSAVGNPAGSDTVDYMVVAGGGGGGSDAGGGGGGGGYRESPGTASGSYTVSPLGVAPAAALPVSATPYAITVGAAGTASAATTGTNGGDSIFSTITSTGGGGGGKGSAPPGVGSDGGSGGGSGRQAPGIGGAANPVTTPIQGTAGGNRGAPGCGSGGGGGAGGVGVGAGPGGPGGSGGAGATSSIDTTPTARAGGGGGAATPAPSTPGAAGAGGGGAGAGGGSINGTAGTINTGGGGGGGSATCGGVGASAGGGIVIIRYRYQ